ncbi:hypothetical protein Bbelb_356720 [Branchiostoma belcheri]|nr:hypothetical protein Bbelb_356720 [Branchiostoma belcheri]
MQDSFILPVCYTRGQTQVLKSNIKSLSFLDCMVLETEVVVPNKGRPAGGSPSRVALVKSAGQICVQCLVSSPVFSVLSRWAGSFLGTRTRAGEHQLVKSQWRRHTKEPLFVSNSLNNMDISPAMLVMTLPNQPQRLQTLFLPLLKL